MNDDFGALTVPMAQFGCDSYSDSFISHKAIKNNVQKNLPEHNKHVNYIKSTDDLMGQYDIVLFKTLKTQVFLKEEMAKLAQHIHSNTLMLGACMAKNLHRSTLDMLDKTIGESKASLAWKKARLIHVNPNMNYAAYKNDIASYQLDGTHETLYAMTNVFCRNKLDIGTRFFLQNLPTGLIPEPEKIIDLGCGNGILALKMAQAYPNATISCIDESYMAVASAQLTIEANLDASKHKISYLAADALTDYLHNEVDLIVCNPPFHQQFVVGDSIAWQMFRQSRDVLRKGGELWVVGNRHLGYHSKLKKIFGDQQLVASNKKFVILKAKVK